METSSVAAAAVVFRPMAVRPYKDKTRKKEIEEGREIFQVDIDKKKYTELLKSAIYQFLTHLTTFETGN